MQHFTDLTKNDELCPHIVTNKHTYQYGMMGLEVLWTAPPSGSGCVELRYYLAVSFIGNEYLYVFDLFVCTAGYVSHSA